MLSSIFDMAQQVAEQGACSLPGVSIRYDNFMSSMFRAVARGYVSTEHADFVAHGLRWGFEAGICRSQLRGQRVFSNYPPAEGEYRDQVERATVKRVAAGKTLDVSAWSPELLQLLRLVFGDYFIFPLSAQPKPLEPGVVRPLDDHTRTGLNAATDLTGLRHRVTSYEDIKRFLKMGYVMHVSDVDAAFPMLPFAPWLWPFLLHRHYRAGERRLFSHINGDFGTRGFPGVFKIFFQDVLLQMARSEMLLTLPMAVHVDDCGMVGALAKSVRREMERFQRWAEDEHGFLFKVIKDKAAAHVQLIVGFWHDSFERTLTLEEHKLQQYMAQLLEFSSRSTLSLRDRQQIAGRMQRAVHTLPPGAGCLLASVFTLMCGLRLGWQKRRTTREERSSYRFFYDMLMFNSGSGFFSFEHFAEGPEVRSDASKSRAYSGGGWCSACGEYDWFKYGTSAARALIDFLEGDTVVVGLAAMGHRWFKKWIPWGVDNQAFEGSAARGSSRAPRLNLLLKRVFVLQVQHQCLLRFFWLSSADNFLADDLSRDRVARFLQLVYVVGFWARNVVPRPSLEGGRVRVLDASEPLGARDLAVFKKHRRPRRDMQKYSREVSAAVMLQAVARGFLVRVTAQRGFEGGDDEAAQGVPADTATAPRAQVRGHVRGARGALRLLLIFMSLMGGRCGEHDGSLKIATSVPYARADIFTGLPGALLSRVEQVMDNRLAPSSMRTVHSAMAIWRPLAELHGWPTVMETDDPDRGGKLAAFVMKMVDDTSLVFKSIEGYVWGLRWFMKLQHQADPVMGVMHFLDFMNSVKVLTWVPHEPRRALPVRHIIAMAEKTDRSDFRQVNFMFFLVILYFTFSRSECPCPKHFTGEESWDDKKHWMVRDFKFVMCNGKPCIGVRFKAVKQDPRVERPTARGDGSERDAAKKGGADWAYVGGAPGSVLDPIMWMKLFLSFFSAERSPTAPMFLAADRKRPYTYTAAMTDLKKGLTEVSPDDTDYGIHGIRVEGYNNSKSANGLELTVAHGLWMSTAHTRYERFSFAAVCSIAAKMVGVESVYGAGDAQAGRAAAGSDAQPEERVVGRGGVVRGGAPVAVGTEDVGGGGSGGGGEGGEGEGDAASPTPVVRGSSSVLSPPPGWSARSLDDGQWEYVPPASFGLEPASTLSRAWRVHHEQARLDLGAGSTARPPTEGRRAKPRRGSTSH